MSVADATVASLLGYYCSAEWGLSRTQGCASKAVRKDAGQRNLYPARTSSAYFLPVNFTPCPGENIVTDAEYNPTLDPNCATGVYIPVDIQDCFHELNKMLPDELVERIRCCEDGDPLELPRQIAYDKIMREEIWNGPKPGN